MPKGEYPEKNTDERILDELSFIGKHMIYVEHTLQDVLRRLGEEPGEPPPSYSRSLSQVDTERGGK